jgi:hypothetical protein
MTPPLSRHNTEHRFSQKTNQNAEKIFERETIITKSAEKGRFSQSQVA